MCEFPTRPNREINPKNRETNSTIRELNRPKRERSISPDLSSRSGRSGFDDCGRSCFRSPPSLFRWPGPTRTECDPRWGADLSAPQLIAQHRSRQSGNQRFSRRHPIGDLAGFRLCRVVIDYTVTYGQLVTGDQLDSALSDGSCLHCGHCQEPVAGSEWGGHRGRQGKARQFRHRRASASRRRRSIDTFLPREPRIPRALQRSVEPSRPPRCLRSAEIHEIFARVAALNRRQAG